MNGNQVGTISTKEQFANKGSNTCNTSITTSETCSSDAGGQLIDQLFVDCNSVGGSCGATYTKQQWLFCPSVGTPVVFATPGDVYIHNDLILVGCCAGLPATIRGLWKMITMASSATQGSLWLHFTRWILVPASST